MKDYLEGSLAHLLERTVQLSALIPRDLERDVSALNVVCRDRLDAVARQLRAVQESEELREEQNQPERLRHLRRLRGEIDHLESVAVTALCRWNDEDRRLNRLAEGLAKEIRYPLPTPVVSCASQGYYQTYPKLRLVCVPLAEARFLLHVPDLYHELGHSLLTFENDAALADYQRKHFEAVNHALRYLAGEIRKEGTGLGPDAFKRYLGTWIGSWLEWSIEFFCDLFAVYTLGPAFAWSHLHLCASMLETDPYRVPLMAPATHPPDGARMAMLLLALERLGFHRERAEISRRWQDFVALTGSRITPEYRRCFPDALLVQIERCAFEAMLTLGCDLADPNMKGEGRRLLNEAWTTFWSSPTTYVAWERSAVQQLLGTVAGASVLSHGTSGSA